MSIRFIALALIIIYCNGGCNKLRRNVVELETSNQFLRYAADNELDSAKAMLLTDLSVLAKDKESFSIDLKRLSFLIKSFKLPSSSEIKVDSIASGNGDVFMILKYPLNLSNNRKVADSIFAKSIQIEIKILRSHPSKIMDYSIDGAYEQIVLPEYNNGMK